MAEPSSCSIWIRPGEDGDDGHFETQTITKAGPTGLLTTSTRALPHQLNTRLLPVPIAADAKTTRAVIRAKAQQAAGEAAPRQDREPFLALQRWLALAGCHRVIVPFAKMLADKMPTPLYPRMRRDFLQLLSCVQTLALVIHDNGPRPLPHRARPDRRGDRRLQPRHPAVHDRQRGSEAGTLPFSGGATAAPRG